MIFRQLFDHESSTYTYLLADSDSRHGIIIDPVLEKTDLYISLLSELNIKLMLSIETHLHADHITAAGMLKQRTHCQIAIGKACVAEGADRRFADGDQLDIGGLSLNVLYTPGHTACSYCFSLPDRIFTGDTLLIRSTGRTDFQSGSAEQAYHSLFSKILTLPKNTWIYPGHDYSGMTQSTIAEEIRYNPRVQVNSAEEYAQIMQNLQLPAPKKIDIALPANRQCGLNASCYVR